MAEEQRCQEGERCQEGIRCANNCGFFGSPATLDLCSKCYRDRLKAEQDLMAVEKSLLSAAAIPSSPSSSTAAVAPVIIPADPAVGQGIDRSPVVDPTAEGPRRCAACRKRVGLTGFSCRCGSTFCGTHRYPEQHACGFDYRTAGREAIARSNPVVKANKLRKI